MGHSLRTSAVDVLSSDRRVGPGQAKADLRKPENAATWLEIGQAMDRVRCARRLSIKEFADKVGRDEAQIRRWFVGTERPQVDAVFAVREFRQPLVIELAHDAGAAVTTQITLQVKTA